MNKDMMNIDDFVREKLNGHSEKEDPKAWLRMKDLLDKEMPEKAAPFYFRMGKPMAFLGAALLIGALCVGGYKVNSIREKSNANSSVKPLQNNNTKVNTTTADNNLAENNNLKENNTTAASGNNNSVNNTTGATANTNTNTTNQINKTAPNNKGNTVNNNNNNKTAANKDVASAENSTNTAASSTKQTAAKRNQNRKASTVVASAGANKKAQQNVNLANNLKKSEAKNTGKTKAGINDNDAENVAQNRVADNADQNGKTLAKNKKKQLILASGASVSSSSKKNKVPRKIKNAQVNKVGSLADASSKTADKDNKSDNKSEDKDLSTDSIAAYTVITKESTSRGFPKKTTRIIDTIDKTKIAMASVAENKTGSVNNTIVGSTKPTKKEIKLAAAESKKANKTSSKKEAEYQKNILAANNNNQAKQAGVTAQTETVIKLKKEKSSLSKWIEGLNLPEAIASAKQDAHNATFFFGVEAGGNYSFPKNGNNFQGVQFGVTGELVFNKHWSLFGAVKYFNRSGAKKVVNDGYSTQLTNNGIVPDSISGANWFYTVRTDSTDRNYKFSTLHSFELPITLRYTVNKFYIMTGINLAYYLPVNVERVEKSINNINVHIDTTNAAKLILSEIKPKLATNDFGSRFGLGYVLGAGYQITPAWQVDFRLVNSFWDNAKGAGAKQVSKDFYRLPSVQLSFGYQFNKARSKATFGPNSNQ